MGELFTRHSDGKLHVIALSGGHAVSRRILKGRSRRRLNPLFVGWLMGWPIGHALCACSATEFTHWQRHMRGALSQLPMASGPWIWAPPAQGTSAVQGDLFAAEQWGGWDEQEERA